MKPRALSSCFALNRRYARSVNLERDFQNPEAVAGYVPTEGSAQVLLRLLEAMAKPRGTRAWTLTGTYGTGKSAFAHYLTALAAPEQSALRETAMAIAIAAFGEASMEVAALRAGLPPSGWVRAVAVGQREPVSRTVARALSEGIQAFWLPHERHEVAGDLLDLLLEATDGDGRENDRRVLRVLKELPKLANTNVLLVADELGKNLEFAAQDADRGDLYLLQQIAELKQTGKHQVYFLGLLHQSFAGYGDRLSATEQSEWTKVQGRFEDIPFQESPDQVLRLIGQAIERQDAAEPWAAAIEGRSRQWSDLLAAESVAVEPERLARAYPLHPLAALVLPQLCTRYAQNDRSLFSFLTGDEPFGFQEFLRSREAGEVLPTFQPHQVYDYFVNSGAGLSSRLNYQRWVEVQGLIAEVEGRDPDWVRLLKTIGVLNLATTLGTVRATPQLVALALCDRPDDEDGRDRWLAAIRELRAKGIVTYRGAADELRLWQGSDFDVEAAVAERVAVDRGPVAEALAAARPLKPLVAQRHYSKTGNLRYFQQIYGDGRIDWEQFCCASAGYDGAIVYWLDPEPPETVPTRTADDRPLVVVTTTATDTLRARSRELRALQQIQKHAPELATDGVARREVRHRLAAAERQLDDALLAAFDWSVGRNCCWTDGKPATIQSVKGFRAELSAACDRAYGRGMRLDNELINRRELTTQGAKARRVLIEAMLAAADRPRLGLEGYGPEVAIYCSTLEATGIHREEADRWGFFPPRTGSGLETVWAAIEGFCLAAKTEQRSLADLYATLAGPPYGAKPGALPVLLAAVLLYRADDVGIYKDGTFIPVLGPEHFELLVKDPSRFSVKYFEIEGLRLSVFNELEAILRSPNAKAPEGVRNASLLMVAKPLFGFVKKLPKFTLQTRRIGEAAQAVLRELQKAQEPDELLFASLPIACGFEPFEPGREGNEEASRAFRDALVDCLREIQGAYEGLLAECHARLHEAFGVRQPEARLREDLRARASYLAGRCIEPRLRAFVEAAADDRPSDSDWREVVAMVVADKPPRSWSDEDATGFELALSELARRFGDVEALQKAVRPHGEGFEVRRLTVAKPSGEAIDKVVWMDAEERQVLKRLTSKLLDSAELRDDIRLQQALLVELSEAILGEGAPKAIDELAKTRTERDNRGYERETR